MNNLKEAASHIEKLEEASSEQERNLSTLASLVKELKEEVRSISSKVGTVDGESLASVPKTIFQEINTSDVFCMAMNAYYEGIMRAFPQLRKEEEFIRDTLNDAITHGLRAVVTLKKRAEA